MCPKPVRCQTVTHVSGKKWVPIAQLGPCEIGAPGGIRTHDPRLRRPILYPAELRAQRWGGDTTRRRQGPSSSRSTEPLTRAYVVSFEAACSLRTVAQFRVVTVAPALRENA